MLRGLFLNLGAWESQNMPPQVILLPAVLALQGDVRQSRRSENAGVQIQGNNLNNNNNSSKVSRV